MFGAPAGSRLLTTLEEIERNRRTNYVYVIQYADKIVEENAEHWFFHSLEYVDQQKQKFQLRWIHNVTYAQKFISEKEVEEFKASYVNPRRVEIVRLGNQ